MEAHPVRVLYVEDDEPFADLLKRILEMDAACTVTIASRLRDGLHIAGQGEHDIILLDLHLPDVPDRWPVPQMLEAACRIPVVVISGHPDPELTERLALTAGAVGYLDKTVGYGTTAKRHALVRKLTEWAAIGRTRRAELARIDRDMAAIRADMQDGITRIEHKIEELRSKERKLLNAAPPEVS